MDGPRQAITPRWTAADSGPVGGRARLTAEGFPAADRAGNRTSGYALSAGSDHAAIAAAAVVRTGP
ncbi:hypothetical protein Voc01_065510 [Virgisporangium ochraceum]|uniref:Uncharacterized protein n=1 Tax=Virgisporangium ochraceum TaxID=65505 RepID=A0A8J4EED2_9ACTN|nr:hypothetical protein Voc01_065510 [Virgisporangium ochraceum]